MFEATDVDTLCSQPEGCHSPDILLFFDHFFSQSRPQELFRSFLPGGAPLHFVHNALFEELLVSARPAKRELFPRAKPEPEPELLSINEKHMLRFAKY